MKYNEMLDEIARAERGAKQYEVPTGDIKLWDLPDGYEFRDENGNVINTSKIVLEKKKLPKTKPDCFNVLSTEERLAIEYSLNDFEKLIICRDAYWKIAGDWKPNWESDSVKYVIYNLANEVQLEDGGRHVNAILAFPTTEMRDAFYENFKDLIEKCKELI